MVLMASTWDPIRRTSRQEAIMSTITVSVHRTAGAGPGSAHGDLTQRMSGYALGSGTITDTLGPDGRQVEALVLLREPALPGIEVTACPVKLLHLHLDGAAHPVVLCLLPDQDPAPLGDLSHPAANEPLCEAVHCLHGEHVCVVLDSQDAACAEAILDRARAEFRALTGALG
jgi:hypothetical protein